MISNLFMFEEKWDFIRSLLLVTSDALTLFIAATGTLVHQFRLLQADTLLSKDLVSFVDL